MAVESPQKIVDYLAKSSRNCVAQALGLVKSYWPSAKISLLGDGMCARCDLSQFVKYIEEAEPMADQIVKMIEQQDVLSFPCHVNMTYLYTSLSIFLETLPER